MMQNKAALPVPEFDRLPVSSLAERIRALDTQQLDQLIGHERNHNQRIQILELLQQRRDQLKTSADRRVRMECGALGTGTARALQEKEGRT